MKVLYIELLLVESVLCISVYTIASYLPGCICLSTLESALLPRVFRTVNVMSRVLYQLSLATRYAAVMLQSC